MAPTVPVLLARDEAEFGTHAREPIAGIVMSVVLSMASATILSSFLTQRILVIKVWTRLPLVVWLVFAIYIDSYFFVFATAILQLAFGVNTSIQICEGAILLCLVCYVTTKFIYLFLVEKAHIIRGTTKPRLKSKLYLFNSFGMIGVYAVVCILNFVFRITRMEDGQCIIGMKNIAMIPLISFDTVVNVYLTILFLIPLKNLYSFKNFPKTPANIRLRTVALRTFIGAVSTLASSIINLTVLMALNGEPGWVCLMCCNSDILFSAVVIQWITSKDNAGTSSGSSGGTHVSHHGRGDFEASTARGQQSPRLTPSTKAVMDDVGDISLASTTRSDRAASSSSDKASDCADPGKISGGVNVVVTTTIKRESKPGSSMFDEISIDDGYASQSLMRPASGPVGLENDPWSTTNRTKISAGPHR